MTEVVRLDRDSPDPSDISRAAECLRLGGLVAFPTETVYGLGVHALDREAVRRLFAAKGRPSNDPLIVHLADFRQLAQVAATVPEVVASLAALFWPGPLTLVLPRAAAIPTDVTAGLDTVGVRVPAHPVARALLAAAGFPIAAPSANLFSRPSPTQAVHVLEDLEGRIDMVLDAGATDVGVESTVLDMTVDPPVILRPGAIALEALQQVLPQVRIAAPLEGSGPRPSPGLLGKHYAPRAPLTLFRGEAGAALAALTARARDATMSGHRVGVVATVGDAVPLRATPAVVADLGADDDAAGAAARLYAALRELDAAGVDVILAREPVHDHGLWRALSDRLRRAAATIVTAQ